MNVKYFKDTDTALLEFSTNPVQETKEITENIYIDLDKEGNLVSMTIEHAKQRTFRDYTDVERARFADLLGE